MTDQTTPPLDLPAELHPVLRDMAEEVAAMYEGARMPVVARDMVALIERAEADRRHAKFYGDKATKAATRANLAEGKHDSLQMSLDLWRARATAAEAAIARVREVLEHHTFVADDKYGDLAASQYYGDSELEAVAAKSITRALDGEHTKQLGGTPTGEFADVCSCGKSYWPCDSLDGGA